MRPVRSAVAIGLMAVGCMALFIALSFVFAFAPVSMQFRAHHYEALTGSIAVIAFALAVVTWPRSGYRTTDARQHTP